MLDLRDGSTTGEGADRSHRILLALSAALDCRIADLFNDGCDSDLGRVAELLRLWTATPAGPGRHRILAVARQEAMRPVTSTAAE
ncbi:hypothetical protein [Methylobacterium trifolii]|uniref:hypothetical protein n=1 Tax=Methylobacterium trifolii TaxID=1003092 RepID=UPI001EE13262|nr:hypothetical protein [Methylobacterium trifolii]